MYVRIYIYIYMQKQIRIYIKGVETGTDMFPTHDMRKVGSKVEGFWVRNLKP